MKKSNITGWQDVYVFTFKQTFKNKAFIISFIILLCLSLLSMPLIKMIASLGTVDETKPIPIKKVYVLNKTHLTDPTFLLQNESTKHITFEKVDDEQAISKHIEDNETDAILLIVEELQGAYHLQLLKAAKSSIKTKHLTVLERELNQSFISYLIDTLEINAEQLAMIESSITTKVSLLDEHNQTIVGKIRDNITETEYWFIYGLLFVVLMVNMLASSQIATSIVTEKSTRVVEYLLISIKPMALIIGKSLAMLSAVAIQMVAFISMTGLSNLLTGLLFPSTSGGFIQNSLPKDIFVNLASPLNLLLCLIVIVLGLLFYSTLAGLAGATVSKMEELGEGLLLFTLTNMVGMYIGIIASSLLMGPGFNWFTVFSLLFPLSSPFILPGAILVGKASWWLALLAIALQVLSITLLLHFVAKVYETLILHTGNKIKVKELFGIFRRNKKEAKHENEI